MAKTTNSKKRKLVKQSNTSLKVKKLDNPISTKQSQAQQPNNYSDSSDSDSNDLPKLLEPYSKDQLIDLICDSAVKDPSLFARILEAADRDVSHRKIFVFGLGWDTTRESLISAFESFGEIEDCTLVADKNTGKAKGYGFVLFKSRKGATKALKNPKKKINNRVASCQLASLGPTAGSQSQDATARKIYVSNVHSDIDAERLRAFFAKFGEIETGPIGFDKQTGKSRGYAMFVYKTSEGAKKVLEEPHKVFDGHQLHCQVAAEGKGKNQISVPVGRAQSQSQSQPQASILAAVAAAQNMALFGHHPSLNATYGGLIANPGAGFYGAGGSVNPVFMAGGLNQGLIPANQVGQVGGSAGGSHGLGHLGAGNASVLGSYGSSAPLLKGLQLGYPNTHLGQPASGGIQGAGGPLTRYPPYL